MSRHTYNTTPLFLSSPLCYFFVFSQTPHNPSISSTPTTPNGFSNCNSFFACKFHGHVQDKLSNDDPKKKRSGAILLLILFLFFMWISKMKLQITNQHLRLRIEEFDWRTMKTYACNGANLVPTSSGGGQCWL